MIFIIDLNISEHAYFFGFIQADGHLSESTRNRGRLSIEINKKDAIILNFFQKLFPINVSIYKRKRSTNFVENSETKVLYIFDYNFRQELKKIGIPVGKKDKKIREPNVKFSKIDYYRGLIDGDGSLGITSKEIPFISLITKSKHIANSYLNFIDNIIGAKKTTSRNKRDNAYNIMLTKEKAQNFASKLYYKNCLCLPRKYKKFQEVLNWQRPKNMKKIFNRKKWDEKQDNYILNHSIKEAMEKLNRSKSSVQTRLWRLKNKK